MSASVVVIVRTKNRPVFLARALRSVGAQTWDELVTVVVNDGGDADEVSRVIAASPLAGSALVMHHDSSLGRSAALNAGLAAAHGDFFAVHDDDDTWDPGFLATAGAWLVEHPDSVAVAVRTEVVYEELSEDQGLVEVGREVLAQDVDEVTLVQTAWQNYVPPIAMLVRTDVLAAIGTFDTSLPVLEDWDFNLRLLSHGPMGFLPERPLAFWHHRRSAEGAAGNSVVAEATDHEAYDRHIRDAYLRRDLAGEGSGLGFHLASMRVLRDMKVDSDDRWTTHSRVADEWNHGHQEHLRTMWQNLGMEVGRLRGEILEVRELLQRVESGLRTSQKELRRQIRADTRPMRQRLRRVSDKVDDLWQVNRSVGRLRRNRQRDRD